MDWSPDQPLSKAVIGSLASAQLGQASCCLMARPASHTVFWVQWQWHPWEQDVPVGNGQAVGSESGRRGWKP